MELLGIVDELYFVYCVLFRPFLAAQRKNVLKMEWMKG